MNLTNEKEGIDWVHEIKSYARLVSIFFGITSAATILMNKHLQSHPMILIAYSLILGAGNFQIHLSGDIVNHYYKLTYERLKEQHRGESAIYSTFGKLLQWYIFQGGEKTIDYDRDDWQIQAWTKQSKQDTIILVLFVCTEFIKEFLFYSYLGLQLGLLWDLKRSIQKPFESA